MAAEPTGYADLLPPRAAAKRLGICPRTLARLVAAGTIPFIWIGRRRRYDPAELAHFIAERKVRCASTSDQARPSGGMPSPSTVIAFAEVQRRWSERKRRS